MKANTFSFDQVAQQWNTLLKSDVTRRDHVDPRNVGSRFVNFIRDGTVFA